MELDRNWMSANRLSVEYKDGVDGFLEFCRKNATDPNNICCPCIKCGNVQRIKIVEIKDHLFRYGIDKSYKIWFLHGEKKTLSTESKSTNIDTDYVDDEMDDIGEMIGDAKFESCFDPVKFDTILRDS